MNLQELNKENLSWILIGLSGQFFFFLRFFMQWLHSERKKESVIPTSFWIFSIIGSLLLLLYAVYRQDPVFIVGQSFGSLVYIRNLQFIYRKKLT
ncbi:MAG: lipid-A-disaccharide synthase N-terminal domain-containing protein [Desulfobulbaceae bacterium]|nr:lipid-A-disaccharide synthase N-terminal domain-containing protein [Desulfobulbaceae bacterium]